MLLEAVLQVHLFFALFSSGWNLSGALRKWIWASVFTKCIFWILSIQFYQSSRIRRLPFWFVAYYLCFVGGIVGLARFSFVLCTSQPENMRRILRTCIGVKDFLTRSATPSWSLLWRAVTRPNFCSQGNVIWRRRHFRHHRIWGGLGDLCHVTGRGNIAIHVQPVPSC